MTDTPMVLLDDVRKSRPPVYLADEWAAMGTLALIVRQLL